jgi:hypothetical protein
MRKQKALERDRTAVAQLIRDFYGKPRLNGGKYHKRYTGRALLEIIRKKGFSIGNGEFYELLNEIREGS